MPTLIGVRRGSASNPGAAGSGGGLFWGNPPTPPLWRESRRTAAASSSPWTAAANGRPDDEIALGNMSFVKGGGGGGDGNNNKFRTETVLEDSINLSFSTGGQDSTNPARRGDTNNHPKRAARMQAKDGKKKPISTGRQNPSVSSSSSSSSSFSFASSNPTIPPPFSFGLPPASMPCKSPQPSLPAHGKGNPKPANLNSSSPVFNLEDADCTFLFHEGSQNKPKISPPVSSNPSHCFSSSSSSSSSSLSSSLSFSFVNDGLRANPANVFTQTSSGIPTACSNDGGINEHKLGSQGVNIEKRGGDGGGAGANPLVFTFGSCTKGTKGGVSGKAGPKSRVVRVRKNPNNVSKSGASPVSAVSFSHPLSDQQITSSEVLLSDSIGIASKKNQMDNYEAGDYGSILAPKSNRGSESAAHQNGSAEGNNSFIDAGRSRTDKEADLMYSLQEQFANLFPFPKSTKDFNIKTKDEKSSVQNQHLFGAFFDYSNLSGANGNTLKPKSIFSEDRVVESVSGISIAGSKSATGGTGVNVFGNSTSWVKGGELQQDQDWKSSAFDKGSMPKQSKQYQEATGGSLHSFSKPIQNLWGGPNNQKAVPNKEAAPPFVFGANKSELNQTPEQGTFRFEKADTNPLSAPFFMSELKTGGSSGLNNKPKFSFGEKNLPPLCVPQDRVPIGEFSCPDSPSESSASEESPRKNESFTNNQSYMFQASQKKNSQANNAVSRKQKSQKVSSAARRSASQQPQKSKKSATNAQFEMPNISVRSGSPMDFSPSGDTPNVAWPSMFREALGQPVEFKAKDKNEREPVLKEDPKVDLLRSGAAVFDFSNVQQSGNKFSEQNGEKQSWHADNDPSARNDEFGGKAFDAEKTISSGFQETWLNWKKEKDSKDGSSDCCSNSVTHANGDSHLMGFSFKVGEFTISSSSKVKRPPRRTVQRLKAVRTTGVAKSSTGQGKTEDPSRKSASSDVSLADGGQNNYLNDLLASNKNAFSEEGMLGSALKEPRHPEPLLTVAKQLHRMEMGLPANASPRVAKSAAAEQLCERWRLRGNQAYASGDFPKAEEYYSRGASSIPPNETSQSCIKASMLCYSNRAATRMAVGRMREALADCMRAICIDPNFLRVRLRAASCHLALGDSKAAASMFKECLNHVKEAEMTEPKVVADATEGIKKSQQLDQYTERAQELLKNGGADGTSTALDLINEALLISSHSDCLLEMKARALLSLRMYDEVVQLCEQSLASAERNHDVAAGTDMPHQASGSSIGVQLGNVGISCTFKLWRWKVTAKAFFYLGRLEDALDLLAKYEEAGSTTESDLSINMGEGSIEAVSQFVSYIRQLLHHKAAGNKGFQAGKYTEAVEHYTAALAACNGDSRPFAAVCFCNRGAASQALGNIADAIADCSRAIALDPNYPKALSRRATLHETVRDYDHACSDIKRLITLLEDNSQPQKNGQTGRGNSSSSAMQDLRQADDRLMKAEAELKKGHPVDHYMIMGVDPSCSANEIKKAYRKAALKHHPDKAGQFLFRGESGDDTGVWKEVADEVRSDAERLFKMIGEAYAVLSDAAKRAKFDSDEEQWKLRARVSSNTVSDSYRYQYEKSGRRQRDRWDSWSGYGHQYQRWQNGPDAAEPDVYARRGHRTSNVSKSGGFRNQDGYDFDRDE